MAVDTLFLCFLEDIERNDEYLEIDSAGEAWAVLVFSFIHFFCVFSFIFFFVKEEENTHKRSEEKTQETTQETSSKIRVVSPVFSFHILLSFTKHALSLLCRLNI